MNTKLTLTLDKEIIQKTKSYAKKNNQSLSQLVESYFNNLVKTSESNEKNKISPITKSLSGIIKTKGKVNYKKEVADYLVEKYL
ncbi:MAG: DUF6364 family protein [Spirochaetia bacterium]|nr:DUF6364 family protein [Spirochaetia bacterium]